MQTLDDWVSISLANEHNTKHSSINNMSLENEHLP